MMWTRKTASACSALIFLGALAWSPSAHALFGDDEARKAIIELRNRFDAHKQAADAAQARLSQELKDSLATAQRSMLELTNQNEQLRAEMARLQGRNEELARMVADLQRQQKDVQAGVDARLRQVEPVPVKVDGQDFAAAPEEQRAFESALDQLRSAQFGAASTGFSSFLSRFPGSAYTPSALYWLGNAQYATRAYRDSIATHQRLAQQFPNHLRAPEALLAVANSQIELKDLKSARATLNDLIKAYPQAEAAAAARERLARLR